MAASHVEPVFLLRRSLAPLSTTRSGTATGSIERYSALDICLAPEETSGRETILGAQDIQGFMEDLSPATPAVGSCGRRNLSPIW